MNEVTSRQDLDAAFSQDLAILFKHSTRCPISAMAREEMDRFTQKYGSTPVYLIDVHEQAELSDYVGERTGIEHQSPQVIVLRGGEAGWHASRMEINASEVEAQMAGLGS